MWYLEHETAEAICWMILAVISPSACSHILFPSLAEGLIVWVTSQGAMATVLPFLCTGVHITLSWLCVRLFI